MVIAQEYPAVSGGLYGGPFFLLLTIVQPYSEAQGGVYEACSVVCEASRDGEQRGHFT